MKKKERIKQLEADKQRLLEELVILATNPESMSGQIIKKKYQGYIGGAPSSEIIVNGTPIELTDPSYLTWRYS